MTTFHTLSKNSSKKEISAALADMKKRWEKLHFTIKPEALSEFVKDNRHSDCTYTITYQDSLGNQITKGMRFFEKNGVVWYLPKWQRKNGFIFNPKQFKNLEISGEKKLKSSSADHTTKSAFQTYKRIERLSKMTIHPALKWNFIDEKFKNLPSSFEDYIQNFQKEDGSYKWLYSLLSFGRENMEIKTIWKGRLETIFWKGITDKLADALENKQEVSFFESDDYDYTLHVYFHDKEKWIMDLRLDQEYRGCGNGYYYIWTDVDNFIFVEKD